MTPQATRGALIVLVGYVFLFLLVVQRIQAIEDVERILDETKEAVEYQQVETAKKGVKEDQLILELRIDR